MVEATVSERGTMLSRNRFAVATDALHAAWTSITVVSSSRAAASTCLLPAASFASAWAMRPEFQFQTGMSMAIPTPQA